MDNLAHALTGGVIGAAVAPKLVARAPVRFLLVTAGIVNFPDVDFALNLVSTEFYHFPHRGLTHSVFGAAFFILLSYWVLKKMLLNGATLSSEQSKQLWLLATLQILIGHYLLDFLTTYGTMFLYPASLSRFSLPLMFIIDPVLWGIAGYGCALIFWRRADRPTRVRRTAAMTLGGIGLWWCVLAATKVHSYFEFRSELPDSQFLASYPGPAAPLLWVTLGERNGRYVQMAHPALGAPRPIILQQSTDHYRNEICPNLRDDLASTMAFADFLAWAEHAVCFNPTELECYCSSVKYAFLDRLEKGAVFTFRLQRNQSGQFLPQQFDAGYLRHILAISGFFDQDIGHY